MTKKDYIKLAKLIKEQTENLGGELEHSSENSYWIAKDTFIHELCDILHEDNLRFNKELFLAGCR